MKRRVLYCFIKWLPHNTMIKTKNVCIDILLFEVNTLNAILPLKIVPNSDSKWQENVPKCIMPHLMEL